MQPIRCVIPTSILCALTLPTLAANDPRVLVAANDNNAPLAFRHFGSDLSAYEGQTVQIRLRTLSDPATEFEGACLDEVQLNDAHDISTHGFEALGANVCQ